MIDVKQAKLSPSSVFTKPIEVVECDEIGLEDKIAILKQWQYDAIELTVAEEENMAGGESSLLSRITRALHILREQRQ